ncbi:MAG: ABC transporter permease [Bacteroidota bacterium]
MYNNYIKVILRNLVKNKWFSLINILGLTVGLTCSLIIYLYISQELSYDDFHSDGDRIYRITRSSETSTGIDYDAAVPYPLIDVLQTEFTQFEAATQIHADDNILATYNGSKHVIDNLIFADSNFFDVLSFQVVSGNPKVSLGRPNTCFITPTLAATLFPREDALGKKFKLQNALDLEVVGFIEQVPVNSHLQFDIIVSYPSFSEDYFGLPIDQWTLSASGYAYVKTFPNAALDKTNGEFTTAINKYYSEDEAEGRKFHLQPLKDIYYNTKWYSDAVSDNTLWSLGIIGVFIVLVGCVNFINLSSALALKKSKEVGIRKTLGAAKGQLIRQSLSETLIVSLVSGLLAIGLTELLIPFFNSYFSVELVLNVFTDTNVLPFLVAVISVVTLLAGLYPAFVLSGYNPVKALKNNMSAPSSGALLLRKSLIAGQFVISQILIICTIIVANQMEYFKSKPLGFETEAIINVPLPDNDRDKLIRFRDQVLAKGNVEKISFSVGAPSSRNNVNSHFYLTSEGKENKHDAEFKIADQAYLETFGLDLKYGRWFNPGEEDQVEKQFELRDLLKESDEGKETSLISYVLNETAVKTLGFSNPEEALGKTITTGVGDLQGEIVGIIADYHLKSLHQEIEPAVMLPWPSFYFDAGLKISTTDMPSTLSHIEEAYDQLFPDEIFNYSFLDDAIASFYEAEKRTYSLFSLFAIISILISCLGLLGMISFVVAQRTKEIGVRKVLGAKISAIVALFSKDFMKLVGVAFFISTPVSWYIMDIWLQDFAYGITIHFWVFALGLIVSGIITFTTISVQSVKAALANPVDALRDE